MTFRKNTQTERQKLGFYTLTDIQRISGRSQSLIWRLAHNGKMPRPTHSYGCRLYYHESELKGVLAALIQPSDETN